MEDERDNTRSLLNQYFSYVNSSNLVLQSAINALHAQETRLHSIMSRVIPERRGRDNRTDIDYVFSPPPPPTRFAPTIPPLRPSPVVTETFTFGTALSPVRVAPTDNQIVAATSVFLYSEIENPVNAICPITQDRFLPTDLVMRIDHCGHLFKASAIRQWFIRNVHCPLCRHDIRDGIQNETQTSPTNDVRTSTINATSRDDLTQQLSSIIARDFTRQLFSRHERIASENANNANNPLNITYSLLAPLQGLQTPDTEGDNSEHDD